MRVFVFLEIRLGKITARRGKHIAIAGPFRAELSLQSACTDMQFCSYSLLVYVALWQHVDDMLAHLVRDLGFDLRVYVAIRNSRRRFNNVRN